MVNTEALDQAIRDSGLRKKYLCAKLGLTYTSLRAKCRGESEWTASEMKTMADVLGLTGRQIRTIFFA